jgi:1-acyl-sn-glycerol-3-phosphate acyltransferase
MTLPVHKIVIAPQQRRNLVPVPCAATMHAECLETTVPATRPRSRLDIFRLLGIGVHLALGLVTAAVVFPFASRTARIEFAQRWARRMIRALGARPCVEGAAPAPGSLLVANHVSWLDILAIASCTPAVFVAKSEVRDWPAIGWLAARAQALFLKRSSGRSLLRVKNRIAALLLEGRSVAIFPEGTTSDGSGVLPFRSGLLQAAVDSVRPVQPVAIAYYGDDGNPSVDAAFIDGMTLWQSISAICRSGPITVRLAFAAPIAPAGRTRKELAREARDTITASSREGLNEFDTHKLDVRAGRRAFHGTASAPRAGGRARLEARARRNQPGASTRRARGAD